MNSPPFGARPVMTVYHEHTATRSYQYRPVRRSIHAMQYRDPPVSSNVSKCLACSVTMMLSHRRALSPTHLFEAEPLLSTACAEVLHVVRWCCHRVAASALLWNGGKREREGSQNVTSLPKSTPRSSPLDGLVHSCKGLYRKDAVYIDTRRWRSVQLSRSSAARSLKHEPSPRYLYFIVRG
jgi:hypothetical protein